MFIKEGKKCYILCLGNNIIVQQTLLYANWQTLLLRHSGAYDQRDQSVIISCTFDVHTPGHHPIIRSRSVTAWYVHV